MFNKIWTNIFENKYLQGKHILDVRKKRGSYIWNSIMKARDELFHGFSFKLGDGASSFWFDNWSTGGALCEKVPFVNTHDLHIQVKDVWNGNNWLLNSLWTQIPEVVLETLQSKSPQLCEGVPDTFVWTTNLSGEYSARAGYSWLLQQSQDLNMGSWGWIWRVPAPENIRFIIWLICHNSLPTNLTLSNRGLPIDATCPFWGTEPESLSHCLQDCSRAHHIWTQFGLNNLIQGSQTTNLGEWISGGVKQGVPCFFQSSGAFGRAGIVLFFRIMLIMEGARHNDRVPRLVRWQPPDLNQAALNTFGSVTESTAGGNVGSGIAIHLGGVTNMLEVEFEEC
ncbi:Reverse transcriptase zinc-binding domain [Sesbania bispinosa]|nr:Reverse transcriptase zinc-binding domain [Sesbania bispinosa]